ncbi:hypothetical protein NR798_04020 [Archangium gephyra]|uniref:hypothetical protein n=1 Tax=Archangium gephyra TaxID=48 RepID=UPI0035D5045A
MSARNYKEGRVHTSSHYHFERLPHPKGQAAEPLLSFPNGALVLFAVSNSEVHMVTRLQGPETVFLPFNQGNDGGAGNPVSSTGGYRTAYLWAQVWARENWLEILGCYLIAQRDKKKQISRVIFPRYHQLDVNRKLQAAVLADGPGTKYLVQHSAGSGKMNSIAWTAHFLTKDGTAQPWFEAGKGFKGLLEQARRQSKAARTLNLPVVWGTWPKRNSRASFAFFSKKMDGTTSPSTSGLRHGRGRNSHAGEILRGGILGPARGDGAGVCPTRGALLPHAGAV